MKLKEDNIDIYNNSAIILNNKTYSLTNSYIVILLILSLLFTFLLFIPINTYKSYKGHVIVEDSRSYINLIIDKSDFPINKNNKLYIKEDKYKYEIISIIENNVLLGIELKDNIKINNNIVVVNILKDRTKLFEVLKNKIKKGFDL